MKIRAVRKRRAGGTKERLRRSFVILSKAKDLRERKEVGLA
jgi:hypothetical protein